MNDEHKAWAMKGLTILFIAILIYLFFSQHIIEAMIVGVVFIGIQRALKYFFFKDDKKK